MRVLLPTHVANAGFLAISNALDHSAKDLHNAAIQSSVPVEIFEDVYSAVGHPQHMKLTYGGRMILTAS